jgi:four helix bundle protein
MADFSIKPDPRYRSFRELTVWQQSMDLAVEIHAAAARLPPSERFDLGRDLRKTVRSIPSNVAEGFNRHSRASYRFHVSVALGSQGELETQVELARRLGHLSDSEADRLQMLIATVGRLLHGLWRSLAGGGE